MKQYDLDLPAHLLTEQVQTDIYKQASSGIVDYGQLSPITELIMQFQSLCSGMNQTLSSLQQTVNELVEDKNKALDLLDKAGVWTGADLLVHDRVASLIRDWQEQQRKIITLQAEVGHLKTEANNSPSIFEQCVKEEADKNATELASILNKPLPKLSVNMDISTALAWLDWYLLNHKLSWPAGEKERQFALKVVNALIDVLKEEV